MVNSFSDIRRKEIVRKARLFATSKHRGQKYNKQDFIVHPIEVFEVIRLLCPEDINLQVAALLHDVIEDTTTTYEEVERKFGADVASLVKEVTKTGYNVFPNLKTQRGVVLKLADRLCNLKNMKIWNKEKQEKYIKKSTFWKHA